MKSNTNHIIQLRILVRDLLFSLDQEQYPGIASVLNRPDGYRQMEDMLLQFAATNQISLSASLAQLEMELA